MKCGQQTCNKEATHRFFWPGKTEPTSACSECKAKALNISRAMGFHLHVEDLATGLRPSGELVKSMGER